MVIRNIVLQELLDVLNSMPDGTKMVRIEYIEHTSKMTIYPSSGGGEETAVEDNNPNTDPAVDPDDDLIDLV